MREIIALVVENDAIHSGKEVRENDRKENAPFTIYDHRGVLCMRSEPIRSELVSQVALLRKTTMHDRILQNFKPAPDVTNTPEWDTEIFARAKTPFGRVSLLFNVVLIVLLPIVFVYGSVFKTRDPITNHPLPETATIAEQTALPQAKMVNALGESLQAAHPHAIIDTVAWKDLDIFSMELEAKNTFRRFVYANTFEDKLLCLHEPESVLSEVKRYYDDEQGNGDDWDISAFKYHQGFLTSSDLEEGIFALTYSPREREPSVLFFRNGRLEWNSYIQLKDQTLNHFLREVQPGSRVFRVRLRQASADPVFNRVRIANLTPGCSWEVLVPPDLDLRSAEVLKSLTNGRDQSAIVELAWKSLGWDYGLELKRVVSPGIF